MDEKILLSSYVLKLKDSDRKHQTLSHFNGSLDFIDVFKDFSNEILKNIQTSSDIKNQHTTHLTLESPIIKDPTDVRTVYGFFSSGVSGEKYKVVNTETNEEELDVKPHHAAFRDVFFLLYVPRLKSKAYLILQRKSQFGVKGRVYKSLNDYLKKRGLKYRVEIDNILHNKVYRKMMDEGRLKRVELIKNKIPRSIEKFMNNGGELEEIKGTFKSSFTSRTSLPEAWKEYLDKLFKQRNSRNGTVEIQGLDNEYDDLEFELELNGKKKTFYMVNQQRIQPDIDITANIEFENGEPTIDSLLSQAKEIIYDITQIIS